MKKIILISIFVFIASNIFALNSISILGGICTPVDEQEKRFFQNAPSAALEYSYIFENNITASANVSFFFQSENQQKLLHENYVIDFFSAGIGYRFSFNSFSIIPQIMIGYSIYYFYSYSFSSPDVMVDLVCYSAKVDFSYNITNQYKILFEPSILFYNYDTKKLFSPVRILFGIGIDF